MRMNSVSLLAAFFLQLVFAVSLHAQQRFTVDLRDRSDDIFKVTLIPEKLSADNNIFQFASTAPGTYQEMHIGRYVKSFRAYNKNGSEIKTEQVSLNQWQISNPQEVDKIIYKIDDTWDTPVDSDQVHPMTGSSIDADNVLINGQCVFGYFKSMQSDPIKVKLEYPEDWVAGTALEKDSEGYYTAENYDHIVDSPFLLGKLTVATENVNHTKVDVYTYSKTGQITSDKLLNSIKDILIAQDRFMEGLPVKRYAFLFHFDNVNAGAWEHSYSSNYVLQEQPLNDAYIKFLRTIVSHEFFHILTPLNIHSELIENFNYEKPVMSQHLWLYEGVTEWAANIIELRDSLIDLNEYLQRMQEKLMLDDLFDKSLSLTDLALNSYNLQGQYPNIYQRGAIVAGLLDIRLIELSGGKRGLREVLIELSRKYGPEKPFAEENFFEEFAKETYPEISDFFNRYVKGTEELPVEEYYSKIGIEYKKLAGYDSTDLTTGLQFGIVNGKLAIYSISDQAKSSGAKQGDIVVEIQGDTISLQNAQAKFFALKNSAKPGDEINMTVLRQNQPENIKIKFEPAEIKHMFKIMEKPTEMQLKLRNIWLMNL